MSISIKTCPTCGQANPATNGFCPNCGEVITGVTPVVRPGQAAHGFFAIPAYLRMPPRRRRPVDNVGGGGFIWLGFLLISIPILLSHASPLAFGLWIFGILLVITGFWRLRIDPHAFGRAGLTTNAIGLLALAGVVAQVARTAGEPAGRAMVAPVSPPTVTATPDWMVTAGSSPTPVAKRWGAVPMFRGEPSHSGLHPGPGPAGNPYRKWRYDTGGEVRSSPAVADGTVFVGSHGGLLYAFDAASGQLRWYFDLGGYPVRSSPAVVDGQVFIGGGYALYALDAATGQVRWRFAMRYAGESSPTVADGVVYTASKESLVYAVDAATGAEKWHFQTEGLIFSSPAVAQGLVLIGSDDGNLYAIDAKSGQSRWRFAVGGEVYSSPAVAGDRVFVVGKNHSTFAVDLRTGKPVWHYPVGGDSSPAIAGGILYVGAEDGGVYALDAATGTLRWLYPTGRPIRGSPVVADGVLYVPSGLTLFALDAINGQERWKYPVGDTIGGSPAVVDGVVYVGDASGYLYALAGDGDVTGASLRGPEDSR